MRPEDGIDIQGKNVCGIDGVENLGGVREIDVATGSEFGGLRVAGDCAV